VAKVGWNVGQFRAMLVLIETVGDGPDGTRFKQRTEGTASVQCLPFSKSKRKFRLEWQPSDRPDHSHYRIPVFGSALEGGESYESKVQWP
jgi:hypothetical protein